MGKQADYTMPVEAAISEVLGAERDALAKIAACEAEAQQTLQQARKAVRELVRNTQHRISRLHSGCAARTRELVAGMQREAAEKSARAQPEDIDGEKLLEAVGQVASELTTRDEADVH